jgi:hypothetical protein
VPAISSLSVNDAAATPVTHTFSPVSTNGAHAYWADRSQATPAGYYKIDHNVEAPNGTRTVHRVTVGFGVPTLASIDGVQTVVRTNSAQVVFNLHPDSTLQERKDLLAFVTNALGLADMKNSVWNIEPFW